MAPKRPSTSTADSSAAALVSSEGNSRRSTRSSLAGGAAGENSSTAASPTKEEVQTKTSSGVAKDKKSNEAQSTSKDAKTSKVSAGKADEVDQADEEAPPAAKKAKKDGVYKRNDMVDDIVLNDENDSPVSLKSLYDTSGLVIFSYPRANTPGCTNQACGYRDIHADFTELGFQVIGLSTDKPGAQMSWKKGKNLPYTLLSDPKKELLSRLGATDVKKRCHWVIEKGGRLAEQDIGVKPASDPTNALNIAKALASTTKAKPAQK